MSAASDLIKYRLANQQIAEKKFNKPVDLVKWMGAIQSQDFPAAKWGVGLRLKNANDADVEKAFNEGKILRTHILRPTWHFVAPDDLRWMLMISGPRVNAWNNSMYRKFGLEDAIFKRSNKAIEKAVSGKQLTRTELGLALKKAKISTDDLRLTLLVMRAELDGVICSGAKREKQFTYALLDEQVPSAKTKTRDEALAELALRYFQSRGWATLQDYCWWSGLSVVDCKKGFEMIRSQLKKEVVDGIDYWTMQNKSVKGKLSPAILLPAFDEYTVAYKNRSMLFDSVQIKQTPFVALSPVIVVNGKIVGNWRRVLKGENVIVETTLFKPMDKSAKKEIESAIKQYADFIGKKI